MQEIACTDCLPRSSAKTREFIERHEARVKDAFNDPRLLAIQKDGEAIMNSFRREEGSCYQSEDNGYNLRVNITVTYKHF